MLLAFFNMENPMCIYVLTVADHGEFISKQIGHKVKRVCVAISIYVIRNRRVTKLLHNCSKDDKL